MTRAADAGAARVVLIGAGGLGCAAAPVLARAAAAGRRLEVVIADDDRVEIGNLHRQVLHRAADAGVPKPLSLARAMAALAGSAATVPWCDRVTAGNVRALVRGAAVVLDGSDNFATRFLVNDACVLERVPLVHAAAIRWQGQILGVVPGDGGPCYRCLFEAPPAAAGMSCAEAGVAGPVVGVVGALAAELALAILDGKSPRETAGPGDADRARVGRLFTYDGLRGEMRVIRFRRNPGCLACGMAPLEALLPPQAYEVPAC